MFKRIPITLFSTIGLLLSLGISTQPAKAYNFTLQDGSNSATYNDDSDLGFTDWQIDGNNLLTQTGLFYRLGSTGAAESIGTLTQPSNPNSNPVTVTYNNPSFDINLTLELSNNGATLSQQAIITNNSGSALDFYLYSYLDLATSNGVGGDDVEINGSTYTATQSGDLETITTTITESISGSNTSLTARRAEADAIDFSDDTLLDKLQFPASGNTPQLDEILTASSDTFSVTTAYEWNYNLAAGESFAIGINSNASIVPWEFSPSLGLLLVGIFGGGYYFKQKKEGRDSSRTDSTGSMILVKRQSRSS